MEPAHAADALAHVSAALVGATDVAGFLATLLASSTGVLRMDAGGILVEDGDQLELLAASSHAAWELELHQAQLDEGPCVDAHASGRGVSAQGSDLVSRWPRFGQTMIDAGFVSTVASPLRWHGQTIGAMGLFGRTDMVVTPEEATVAQAFADLATLLIVQTDKVDLPALESRVQVMLTGRIVIEQAKGVLAEIYGVDMGEAYHLLLLRSAEGGGNLSATARTILDEAQQGLT